MSRLYLLYGVIVIGLLAAGEYRGFSFATINALKNVPRSVRDNPGSYRSVYSSYHHYSGGK